MTQFALSTDGTRIAYELIGAGRPALVLVHGWSCDRTNWNAQLESLSRNFTVVTVDLAGHGESECGREAWSIAAFGSDVALVVTLTGLEDVVLVGHSMGGDVILEAARRLSTRVRGLIWVDTYSALPKTSSNEDVQREGWARFEPILPKRHSALSAPCLASMQIHPWSSESTRYVSCPCRCCAWGHGGSLDLRPRRSRAAE